MQIMKVKTLEMGIHTLLSKDYPSVKTSIFITSTQLAKTESNNGHTLSFQNHIRHLFQQYATCLIPANNSAAVSPFPPF